MSKKVKISQSLMKDIYATRSVDPKEIVKPKHCPRHLKYKYVDGLETVPSDAMLDGKYFEWHLLGATRNGIEPILPKINVRDLRPTKSASKNAMFDYIMSKAPDAIIKGTGKRADLKPKASASIRELHDYVFNNGGRLPEGKVTKPQLFEIIEQLPENLGEPEITTDDLFAYIQTMPEDWSEGSMSQREIDLQVAIHNAKIILKHMGIPVDQGEKQVFIQNGDECGTIDWITTDIQDKNKNALYDVKFTNTQVDDWRNGWGDPYTKEDAKLQATHYVNISKKNTGTYAPFYFLVFGKSGWVKVLRYRIGDEHTIALHEVSVDEARKAVKEFEKNNWPAKPSFNRCLACDFQELCEERSLLPEVEEIYY